MERGIARIAAVLAVIACPGVAAAQLAGPAPIAPPGSFAPAAAQTTADTALNLGTADSRMTVPVSIDAKGPWGFVIDTGAERTVVSRELASRLGLVAGPDLRVVAMTGPKVVPSVVIPSLSVSSLHPTTVNAPALEERNLGAAGLLGIDSLQGHRVDIDFEKSAIMLRPSYRNHLLTGVHGDEIVVTARSVFGQLIVTDARWRGQRIAVVLDTGSAMTVGNAALLRMLQGHARPLGPITALSVTGERLDADLFVADDVRIGSIRLDQVPIAFADVAPFHRFGLEKKPALMLGMETLRMFRHVRIDFANRAIEFVLPRPDGTTLGGHPG